MSKVLILGISVGLIVGLLWAGAHFIDSIGELVHFNARPQSDRVVCELTREPLIGKLETQQFDKSRLRSTTIQSRSNQIRLALVTQSGEQIPLTRNWSISNNQQLLQQRESLDRFLADPKATTIEMRTHRPGYLWVILAVLIGAIALVGKIALHLIKP
ncbi:hypothetical protein H6F51_17965 [Cyanobacteria bacterium FACHB-DQ100]|nr:hypothetical protein [Cyanobacteria bacterium FACHB-DQ100]